MTKNISPFLVVITLIALLAVVSMRRDGECPPCPAKRAKGAAVVKNDIVLYGVTYPYQLPRLPYPLDGLEPYADVRTMEIHLTKHHQGYINKLNAVLERHPAYQNRTLEWLLMHLDVLPDEIQGTVCDNGGGHFNHLLFWDSMSPAMAGENLPHGDLAEAINRSFGSFDAFKKQFDTSALSHVGSGWTWLCMDPEGGLQVLTTLNHDTPLQFGWYPLLIVDIWEHAYYLNYQNRRPEFVSAWWQLVDWNKVAQRYGQALRIMRGT